MALEFAFGKLQWLTTDVLNSDKAVSGLGFQPKAIRFTWCGLQSAVDASSNTTDARLGVGFVAAPAGSVTGQRAVGAYSADAAAASDCGNVVIDNGVVVTVDGSGTVDGRLSVQSIDSDGFTLNVDDVTPANLTVFWEAWGGSDITVAAVGDVTEPAATGDQDITVTGFVATDTDQVVMFGNSQTTAALNTGAATDCGFGLGFATGAGVGNQASFTYNVDDASTTTDTDGYTSGTYSIARYAVGGGIGINAAGSVSAFLTDGFRINWTSRATTGRRSVFLAIKGGSWKASTYEIDGTTGGNTATVSGLAFTPKGALFIGQARVVAQNPQARASWGVATGTSARQSMGAHDENNLADSDINLDIEYDQILVINDGAGATWRYDINAWNSDGFQVIGDTVGAVLASATEIQGYLVFGDAPAGGGISIPVVQHHRMRNF